MSLSVVLIGGSITLNDGSVLDSRQKFVDDPTSKFVSKACLGEWGWWEVVESLVSPIVASAMPSSYCLALTPRSAVLPQADGSIKRKRLKSLLSGGVGVTEVQRLYNDEEKVAVGDAFQFFRREHGGWLAVSSADQSRWRFLDGNTYYLRELAPDERCAAVVVDPHQLVSDLADGKVYDSQAENLTEGLCSGGEPVVILPHTSWTEALVAGLLDPAELEIRPRLSADLSQQYVPKPTNPLNVAQPLVSSSAFGVTGFATTTDGWRQPEALESARRLLSSRFDIEVGIWDLVNNDILRESLLELHSLPKVPLAQPIPDPARLQATALAEEKDIIRELEKDRSAEVVSQVHAGLDDLGWTLSHGFVRLAIAEPYVRWIGYEARSPLEIRLNLKRRKHVLDMFTSEYNQIDLGAQVVPYIDAIEVATGTAVQIRGRLVSDVILLERQGGWADADFDVQQLVDELRRITPQLFSALADLADMCEQVAQSHE